MHARVAATNRPSFIVLHVPGLHVSLKMDHKKERLARRQLSDLRDRQKATTERVAEMKQQRKRQRVERAAEEAAAKRRVQEERSAARLKASTTVEGQEETAGAASRGSGAPRGGI